jgi:hypothetical protein
MVEMQVRQGILAVLEVVEEVKLAPGVVQVLPVRLVKEVLVETLQMQRHPMALVAAVGHLLLEGQGLA